MRFLMTLALLVWVGAGAAGCGGVEEPGDLALESPSGLETGTELESSTQGLEVEAMSCTSISPPRCGPRNCVAMCVTCLFDICRLYGGSCSECRAEMEYCKQDCYDHGHR